MRPLGLKTILVATDLSPAHMPALRTAGHLAALTGGRLFVVHAIEDGTGIDADEVRARIREAEIEPVAAEVVVQRGPPGAIIGQEARRVGADVVILGPHRHRDPSAPGGTADRVVRTAATPCLIVPAELRLPLDRVLAPVDASVVARGALSIALTWASALRDRKEQTRVFVLHVAPRIEPWPTHDHTADVRDLEAEVEQVRTQVSGFAHVDVESAVIHEEPQGQAIVDYAAAQHMDLIVIGTRGKLMTGAGLLGSVSSVVVRNAPCPVLLVPPEQWLSPG